MWDGGSCTATCVPCHASTPCPTSAPGPCYLQSLIVVFFSPFIILEGEQNKKIKLSIMSLTHQCDQNFRVFIMIFFQQFVTFLTSSPFHRNCKSNTAQLWKKWARDDRGFEISLLFPDPPQLHAATIPRHRLTQDKNWSEGSMTPEKMLTCEQGTMMSGSSPFLQLHTLLWDVVLV